MSDTCIIIQHEETDEIQIVGSVEGYEEGWNILSEKQPWPGEFDVWSLEQNKWVEDTNRKADTEAGQAHKDRAHLLKSIEATLIRAGYMPKGGILEAEAVVRKISVEEMAALVYAKATDFKQSEIERISAKAGA